ncbi:MAG: hypothetical protein JNK40_14330 [Chromatiales bacterium]|nr:hypothetical protein [Chromatiales bacterium]
MKTFFANTTLLLVSLGVALLVGEAGLRLTGYQPGNPLGRLINHRDDFLGYRMIPGMHESVAGPGGVYTVDTVDLGFDDGIGFRDDGITPPVDSVFIGDSFVWGYGVELRDSISERFEALTGRDAVNLGMTSWTSPTQYSRLLSRYGVPLRPRYAFMEALIDNDFGDLPNFAAWEATPTDKSYPEWMTDRVMRYEPDALSYKVRRVLYDHSALYRLFSDRVQFGIKDPEKRGEDSLVHITGDGLDMYLDPRQLQIATDQVDAGQIRLFRLALERSQEIAARNGIHLVVFIVPTKEMVYQDRFPDPALRAAVDWRYTALLQLLAETGIDHVDLLPPLRQAAAEGKQLYFQYDTHWTPLGHDVAARVLAGRPAPPRRMDP